MDIKLIEQRIIRYTHRLREGKIYVKKNQGTTPVTPRVCLVFEHGQKIIIQKRTSLFAEKPKTESIFLFPNVT